MNLMTGDGKDVFFIKFPWLEKLIPAKKRRRVQQIRESWIDRTLLERTSHVQRYGEDAVYEEIFLLDQDGNILRRELPLVKSAWWKPQTWLRRSFVNGKVGRSTVAERIMDLEEEGMKLAFIFSAFGNRFVIYKPPSGFNICSWIEEREKETRNKNEVSKNRKRP